LFEHFFLNGQHSQSMQSILWHSWAEISLNQLQLGETSFCRCNCNWYIQQVSCSSTKVVNLGLCEITLRWYRPLSTVTNPLSVNRNWNRKLKQSNWMKIRTRNNQTNSIWCNPTSSLQNPLQEQSLFRESISTAARKTSSLFSSTPST